MEQNGTTTDKRNWRERLGIGTRDMPKLSDEFKGPTTDAAPAAAPRPAVRAPQPIAKPAPMAPRHPAPKPVAAPVSNGRQTAPAPSGSDALAEKLRAQRAAAEKLAEQRVAAARERAESRSTEPAAAQPARPRPVDAAAVPAASAAPKPKFSFADDSEPAPRPANGPLVPPRPALGGERSQPPFLRQAAQPNYRAETPSYRSGEPGALSSPRAPGSYRAAYGGEPGAYGSGTSRRPAYDSYARQGEPTLDRGYPGDSPRLGRPAPARGRARSFEDDQEDVFEDDPQPRRRASARDYQSAYAEHDEPFEEDRRRSSGPWLLLLALALVTALAVGAWLTYGKYWKLPATVTQSTDQVPVVAAPEDPAKTAPEAPAEASTGEPAAQRKQIYDRIVGEQEATGEQVVPTEEVPVQPEPTPVEPVGQQGANDAGAAAIPEPTATVPDATQETEPLPLPPPPETDQQGSLAPAGTENLAATTTDPPAMPPPDPATAAGAAAQQATSAASSAADAATAPVEATANAAQAAASDATAAATTESAALTEQAAPPSTDEPAVKAEETVIEPPPPPKAATKTKTAAKKKATTEATEDLGAEPVVLVPPSDNPIQGGDAATASQSTTTTTAPAKKKTIFDLFKSGGDEQQVAAVEPEPAPAPSKPATTTAAKQPETTASTGSGYTIQLASFRTQGEAQEEYNRLRSSYPDIIGGLPSKISQATVAGSTRYRVGVGPVGSKEQANSVCSKLFAAGERDCLIRGP